MEEEKTLEELRREIDGADNEIMRLFAARMDTARKVARFKSARDMPIFQPARERELIDRAKKSVSAEYAKAAELVITNIMDLSKCVQVQVSDIAVSENAAVPVPALLSSGRLKVCCQGAGGSYSDTAREMLGFSAESNDIAFVKEFEDVFRSVESGESDFGVLPIYNFSVGSVDGAYDLMGGYNFYICGSVRVKIGHVLAALPGARLDGIKTVLSHEQALRQCRGFIKERGLTPVKCLNTAFAAEEVKNSGDFTAAAICGEEAAKTRGLDILAENTADYKDNATNIVAISAKPYMLPLTGGVKCFTISAVIPNVPDSLRRVLTRFSYCGLDISRIHSRPVWSGRDEVIFYFDVTGDGNAPDTKKMLCRLGAEMKSFRYFGTYISV